MLISILTGFAAGAIHVVGGADHLVAMAPTAINKPRLALRDGLAWGLGHSTGVVLLASLAVVAKDLVNIEQLSSVAESIVGITLLIVGTIAIKTSLGLNIHIHNHQHGSANQHHHVHLHLLGRKIHGRHTHASTGLGLIHGMAGASHLLAVIPALALPTLGAISYIFAYLLGSMAAMASVVLGISFTSMKAGQKISPRLLGFTGGLSIVTGLFWLQKNPIIG
ncbi:hydantoin utilization protein A [Prochlorococcus sp. MIT 1223]|uniref:hydantoin utilization protein A n=1 Tax=Prochlorococcus sp. MIT 1223 TaxID=3096217 RepID=UPI002A760695|nr:hydantoin utilization protein A [Prochlorococcus sp. MIT 1223]